MKIICAKDYRSMSRRAAGILAAQIVLKPDSALGLATGSSPLGTYEQLVEWYRQGDLDFSEIRAVNLDEYCGLEPSSPQSYAYFMQENLFRHVNIAAGNTHLPDGTNPDAVAECARYNQIIRELGGIDLQLLGIGHNGHIGFNEPGEAFERGAHCVTLSESTIEDNKRFFKNVDEVPRKAYTMGIGNIMSARRILLIASGESKADILLRALTGPIAPSVPASVLQLHADVTVVADEAALSRILERSPLPDQPR